MSDKETLQKEIYQPTQELKNKFYQAKTQAEWDACKEELKVLLEKIDEPMMTTDFALKYKKSLVDSIAKMWAYKQPYFEKQQSTKTYQPKITYLFQDDLAQALTRYIQIQTKMLELDYEARCGAKLQDDCL